MRLCRCGQPTEHEDRGWQCRECRLGERRALREQKRRFLADLYGERGCAVCGERDPVVIEPHHLDPANKYRKYAPAASGKRPSAGGGIAGLMGGACSLARLVEELNRCVLLCANDHKRAEAGRIDPALLVPLALPVPERRSRWDAPDRYPVDRPTEEQLLKFKRRGCPHGHPYTPENTSIARNGAPVCRVCANERKRAARAAGAKW